jgi:glycosidase
MKGLCESREQASNDDSFLLSPDGGYDISNFVKVDPMFGTNEDLVKLFQEAEKLGIKIILDLVRKISSSVVEST